MKIKKILFLLLFPVIAELAISCGDCNCEEIVFLKYSNKSISLENIDNSGESSVVTSSDSALKTAYGIKLQLTREQTACGKEHGFVFFPSAYAKCDCPSPNQFLPKDSITSIKVFSLNAFDSDHGANADVSAYFKAYRSDHSFISLGEFPKYSNMVLENETYFTMSVNLLLMTAPAMNTQHAFKVQLTLTDGRILEQTIEIVLI
jgi:hypothetical protein